MADHKKEYHNKGQEDRSKGKQYNNPSKFIDWFDPSTDRLRKTDEKAKAYRKGWEQQKKDSGK